MFLGGVIYYLSPGPGKYWQTGRTPVESVDKAWHICSYSVPSTTIRRGALLLLPETPVAGIRSTKPRLMLLCTEYGIQGSRTEYVRSTPHKRTMSEGQPHAPQRTSLTPRLPSMTGRTRLAPRCPASRPAAPRSINTRTGSRLLQPLSSWAVPVGRRRMRCSLLTPVMSSCDKPWLMRRR